MTKRFLLLLLAGAALAAPLHAAPLFERGSDWRWRPGNSEASTPIDAWRQLGFNDAQFTTAPSPFWYDSLGDSSTMSGGTVITGMQGVYWCIFLRKTFVITNLSEVAGLRLGTIVDDGFVAWINTNEVLRVNMTGATGDPVTATSPAVNAIEPVSFTFTNLPPPSSYLVPGTNIIAVQVFQSALGSSDLGFDASLEVILVETNPPTVLSVDPAPGTITNLNQITVTFSEPVTGVAEAHLLVNGVGATSFTAIDSATYNFTFVQPPYGNVAITWSSGHNIYDQALPPNRFNETGPGATWAYTLEDHTAPTVAGLSPAGGATVRTLTAITVLFSEPVSGVDMADLLINNNPASGLTPVAASEYIFTFPQPPTGAVQVAWAAGHGIIDQAMAPNAFAGGAWSYRLDPNAADAPPYISEFMASNTRTLTNDFNETSDWIEIYNPSALTVNLDGWYLTDSLGDLTKWRFPATNLTGGGFLVVFASGRDRRIPGARLHTSFQLAGGGEYLALVRPDGVIVSEFRPQYPSQVPDVSYGFAQVAAGDTLEAGTNGVYFTTPTPGAANLGGTAVPGPIIEAVQQSPNVPLDNQDLLVTARVLPSFRAVASVTMRYRIMFSNEVTATMFDDGAHGDGAAGDRIYGATIPANLSTNGQMIRYLIAATDVNANASRWPLFTNPTNTAEYLGTIVDPTNVTSKLPIFHLFAPATVLDPDPPTSQVGADGESGGRIAIFYDGEFYDNVYMELRGNTSAGQQKKSHRLEFNREHTFRHLPEFPRVRKTSFMAEFLDPAYIRQHLCFWLLDQMGVPSPFFYPVRAQLNGQFYALVFHNDVIGQDQVERMGYDSKGALYKAAGNILISRSSTGVFQKLEPDGPPDYTDYNQLCNGIVETATVANRRIAAFDMMDIPEIINYLAGARWCAENDDVWANMSIYRDTYGDQLWRIIPFDMNASWGQRYGGITPLDAIADNCKSHPLYGGSTIIACDGSTYNRIYDVVIAVPELRQMLLRRQRTVLDRWVLEQGVSPESRLLETHIRYMTNLIWTEAFLDRAKWGYSTWTASNKPLTNAVDELFNQFINLRRIHFSATHNVTNVAKPVGITPTSNAGIPLTQPPNAYVTIIGVEANPASSNQDQEYICLTNPAPFAVDISGWKLDGGVQFTFAPGTVLPSNGIAYVSPNVRAFKARTTGPRGGQGLFVLGPYKGQLSARGETVSVINRFGQVSSSLTYAGAPSQAQQFLRITELMYNPSAHPANPSAQEFEYIELKNISTNVTLSLAGVRLTNGVDFNFTGSAVTTLAPGARVLVVKNPVAFNARYGSGLPVAGQFTGNLENDGERVQLLDASNEEILDFSYDDDWYPITDGLGFSLVIVDEMAAPDAWDTKPQWRPSGTLNGNPAVPDPGPPTIAPILINEALTRTDNPPPTDSIELFNPTGGDVNIGGWWLSDDFNAPKKFRIPDDTTIFANSYRVFTEADFNPGGTGFALSSDGDEVWLFSADAMGNLTGYVHGHAFGAADDGVSFGRHVTSEGKERFVAQSARTLGAANAAPRVGPIVINEIMYRPPDIGTNDNSEDEFIELLNITGGPVPLFDPVRPTNTWKLTGGVDFVFPTNQSLAAGQFLLLVNFNPGNAMQLAAFRAKYGVATNVPVFGSYEGKLDNAGEDIELKKPTLPLAGQVPYVLMDKVSYEDTAPWPAGADGFGLSLQRLNAFAYGNDPANWKAAPPTAGAGGFSEDVAPAITAQPQSRAVLASTNVVLSVSASGSAPLGYQWRFNGANLDGATNSLLSLLNVQPEEAGTYSVAVFNSAGSAVSSNAILTVLLPATILQQPQSINIRPTSNVTFSVVAFSPAPLRYQWQRDGSDLLNATNTVLTIPNVQPADSGTYAVIVSDDGGSILSAPAVLLVMVDPVITQNPLSQPVVPGSTVVLSVAVTNNATLPVGYRWRRNGTGFLTNVLNSRTGFLTLANAQPPQTNFQVVVVNPSRPSGFISTSAFLTYVTDSDGDGIPDWWEAAYGFGTNNMADGTNDWDGDTMSNWAEYIAGTDPTNALSYLKVENPTGAPAAATIEFMAVSNRTYTLQYNDALTGAWQTLADVVARATNRVERLGDPAATANRFYRLVTPRQQ